MVKLKVNNNPHMKRLRLIKEFSTRLCFGLFVMVLTVLIQLALPKAVAFFIDNAHLQQSTNWYTGFAAIMLLVLVIQAIATALRYYLFESTGLLIVMKVRRILHKALVDQSITFYDKYNIGELNNRLSVDVEVLHDTLTMGLAISLRSMCILIGGAIMLLLISPLLSVILLFFIPISLYLGKWVGDNIRVKSKNVQLNQSISAKIAYENFSNIKLVHAFNGQRKAQSLYNQKTAQAYKTSIACTRFSAGFQGVSSFITYLALLITLWIGAGLISQGELTTGELTSFILYAAMLAGSADAVSYFWSEWMRAIGATERIFEIIESSPQRQAVAEHKQTLQGSVVFKNVYFSYPERANQYALKNLDLLIAQGEKVALIGPSGAGKSTIANLLLGFYMANKGKIEFDGVPIENLDINAIRNDIAIVEQEPLLFSSSIFDNIAYACTERQPLMEDIRRAAKLANADDFIVNFPEGYNTLVGDRGVQLSGGQKQRIAIARALLRDPKILILDEATSALDSSSELQVQQALDNLMHGRTTIMIAHRYSTIAKADRIVVLDQGCIVEQGTHDFLSQIKTGLYYKLVMHQKVVHM